MKPTWLVCGYIYLAALALYSLACLAEGYQPQIRHERINIVATD